MNYIKVIIKQCVLILYNIAYYILPINKKIILFESSVGRNYTGNPKAIYEEMVNEGLDKKFNCIWVLENINQYIPGDCKKVKRLRFKYFYYMIVAKFWIMDSRQPSYLKKKKGNIYIQTWHGTPLKKLGLDMNFVNMGGDNNIERYKREFKNNTKRWDYLISQNAYSSKIFRDAFAFEKNILEIGYPRNDIFFDYNIDLCNKLKSKLKISNSKKIILYAPTWRDNDYKESGKYKFNLAIDLDLFSKNLSKEYVLILKPHYLIVDSIDISKYKDNVRLCGVDHDIQELFLISDILITDYSSVMFDYTILKKPIIFFMYDLEEYNRKIREFYFNIIQEAPGRIVTNNENLIEAIRNCEKDLINYNDKFKAFCEKYNKNDKGDSAEKVVEIIELNT